MIANFDGTCFPVAGLNEEETKTNIEDAMQYALGLAESDAERELESRQEDDLQREEEENEIKKIEKERTRDELDAMRAFIERLVPSYGKRSRENMMNWLITLSNIREEYA